MNPLLEHLDAVESTNDVVRERLLAGAPHGAAVWAHEQRAGRGRNGRTWHAPPGATLPLSIGLRLGPGTDSHAALVPIAAGLGAAEAIESLAGLSVALKWPNDLHVGDRKLGGILCEGVTAGSRLVGVVVGVGVNVDLDPADLPADVAARATSVRAAGATVPTLEALAGAIRAAVVRRCDGLFAGDVDAVLSAFAPRDWLRGRSVRTPAGDGIAAGLDPRGRLLVEAGDGVHAVLAGEVELLP